MVLTGTNMCMCLRFPDLQLERNEWNLYLKICLLFKLLYCMCICSICMFERLEEWCFIQFCIISSLWKFPSVLHFKKMLYSAPWWSTGKIIFIYYNMDLIFRVFWPGFILAMITFYSPISLLSSWGTSSCQIITLVTSKSPVFTKLFKLFDDDR